MTADPDPDVEALRAALERAEHERKAAVAAQRGAEEALAEMQRKAAAGVYRSAPERIRIARIAFAFLALASLVGLALIMTLHPAVTPANDAIANQVVGALVALNMMTFRFLYQANSPPKR